MPNLADTSASDWLVAVDIGNTRLKFGLFDASNANAAQSAMLPAPVKVLDLTADDFSAVDSWLAPLKAADLCVVLLGPPATYVSSTPRSPSVARLDLGRLERPCSKPLDQRLRSTQTAFVSV